jgi:hypothetical protein
LQEEICDSILTSFREKNVKDEELQIKIKGIDATAGKK